MLEIVPTTHYIQSFSFVGYLFGINRFQSNRDFYL